MKTLKIVTIFVLSAFAFFGAIQSAQALDMYTSAQHGSLFADDVYAPPDPDVFARVDFFPFDYASGGGHEDGAIAADAHSFLEGDLAESFVSWSNTYTNMTGMSQSYSWDFFIPGGGLSIWDWDMYGSGTDPMMASYSIEILLDGTSVWDSSATLEGNADSGYTYSTAGTVLPDVINVWGGSYEVRYNPYMGSVDLGIFGNGESFDIEYRMSVQTLGGYSLPFGGEGGPFAAFGDPFAPAPLQTGVSGSLSSQPAGKPVIPEPATMLLLGFGLLALVGLRRKLKK